MDHRFLVWPAAKGREIKAAWDQEPVRRTFDARLLSISIGFSLAHGPSSSLSSSHSISGCCSLKPNRNWLHPEIGLWRKRKRRSLTSLPVLWFLGNVYPFQAQPKVSRFLEFAGPDQIDIATMNPGLRTSGQLVSSCHRWLILDSQRMLGQFPKTKWIMNWPQHSLSVPSLTGSGPTTWN